MPELLEIEYYRRLAERALRRTITSVSAPDAWYLKGGTDPDLLAAVLLDRRLVAARRIGKVLLVETDDAVTVGLRFGMTGVLEVDTDEGVEQLEYASRRRDPAWIRFRVGFDDGGELQVRDARRLGGVEVDPPLASLGVDAMAITPAGLTRVLERSRSPLKARLMDQHRIAGLGNLLTDEILWRARLDPAREAGGLEPRERRRLHRHLRTTLDELLDRGGSHLGDLMVGRARGGRCPRCGAALDRRTIGGRTTYSCPVEQR